MKNIYHKHQTSSGMNYSYWDEDYYLCDTEEEYANERNATRKDLLLARKITRSAVWKITRQNCLENMLSKHVNTTTHTSGRVRISMPSDSHGRNATR